MSSEHEKWMKVALTLAKRGLGNVAPNPAVGCLLVADGIVVGRGWTQPGGRPHAETCALEMAGSDARGATAYVTLEPCAHHGKTPPCAEALIAAGVSEVRIAVIDSDSRVSGKGIAKLENAGLSVVSGELGKECRNLNAGFFNVIEKNRPWFTLKSASSIDGRIATAEGDSKWITGAEARRYGHMLRSQHDAILVGVNTVIADDPSLDCRIDGLQEHSPTPIILDSFLRLPTSAKLVQNSKRQPSIVICNEEAADSARGRSLLKHGVALQAVRDTRDLTEVTKVLASRGITRVLVEGGGQVLASFSTAGYCDELLVFTAGKIIGADGLASVGNLALAQLVDAPHLTLKGIRKIGADLLATYVNAE